MMRRQTILRRIMTLGGLATHHEAWVALRATLGALGERLAAEDRGALTDPLPDELAALVRRQPQGVEYDLDGLFDRIRQREETSLDVARAHGQVVCRVLGEAFDEGALAHLSQVLPPSFVELFGADVQRETFPGGFAVSPPPHDRPSQRQRLPVIITGREERPSAD